MNVGSGAWGVEGTRASLVTGSSFNVPLGEPGEQLSYFRDSAWHVLRYHTSLPTTPGGSDGAVKLWIDGTLVIDESGLTVATNEYAGLSFGANTNRSPIADQNLWWDYIAVYNTNPGWV